MSVCAFEGVGYFRLANFLGTIYVLQLLVVLMDADAQLRVSRYIAVFKYLLAAHSAG